MPRFFRLHSDKTKNTAASKVAPGGAAGIGPPNQTQNTTPSPVEAKAALNAVVDQSNNEDYSQIAQKPEDLWKKLVCGQCSRFVSARLNGLPLFNGQPAFSLVIGPEKRCATGPLCPHCGPLQKQISRSFSCTVFTHCALYVQKLSLQSAHSTFS